MSNKPQFLRKKVNKKIITPKYGNVARIFDSTCVCAELSFKKTNDQVYAFSKFLK